ncbi:MAG: hypothetical protein M1817_002520 [Caeruleum heppii]|nr:MAG: hypothetical protein M1817_002520 [Caeruleum heppii]
MSLLKSITPLSTFCLLFIAPQPAAFETMYVPDAIEENFDPAQADLDYGITCIGPLPAWKLPRISDWDPNTSNLQELCAKPQYGGKGPGQHLAGWCDSPGFDEIGFDFLSGERGVRKADGLANPRLELYCRTRCQCDVEPRVWDSGHLPHGFRTFEHPARLTYQVKLDVADDYVPGVSHTPSDGRHVRAVRYNNGRQAVKEWHENEYDEWVDPLQYESWVSLDEENEISCAGDFPDWPAPHPFEWSKWNSLQQLCAVQLSGGHFEANAGGYCHRVSDQYKVVHFADEMTPRPDWTWTNIRVSLAVRDYCRTHCRCVNDDREIRRHLWALFPQVEVLGTSVFEDGSVTVRFQGAQPQGDSLLGMLVIVPHRVSGATAPRAVGTCGADGKRFCHEPWPSDLLGPTPAATPYVPAASPPPAAVPTTTTTTVDTQQCAAPPGSDKACGCSGCNSVSECAWSEFGACKCIAHAVQGSSGTGRFLGVCSQILSGGFGKRRLRRRREIDPTRNSTDGDGDAETKDPIPSLIGHRSADGTTIILDAETRDRKACPCNASYVSYACCGSVDGFLHEPVGDRLGGLVGEGGWE